MQKFEKERKKKEKKYKQEAEAEAKLRQTDVQELIFGGILEASKIIAPRQLSEKEALAKLCMANHDSKQTPQAMLSSNSNLGSLAKKFPEIAKKFNVAVDNSLSTKPVLPTKHD
eukprot:11834057-Karenia_brevis.AAC.1